MPVGAHLSPLVHWYPAGQHVLPEEQHVALGPGQQPQFLETSLQQVLPSGQAAVALHCISHAPPPSGNSACGGDGDGGLLIATMQRFPGVAERRINLEPTSDGKGSVCHTKATWHPGPYLPQSLPSDEQTSTGFPPLIFPQSQAANCLPGLPSTENTEVSLPKGDMLSFHTCPPMDGATHPVH